MTSSRLLLISFLVWEGVIFFSRRVVSSSARRLAKGVRSW